MLWCDVSPLFVFVSLFSSEFLEGLEATFFNEFGIDLGETLPRTLSEFHLPSCLVALRETNAFFPGRVWEQKREPPLSPDSAGISSSTGSCCLGGK